MDEGPLVRPAGRPVVWLAALPFLLIPCCWLWWWAAGLHPGLEIGRSAIVLLGLAAASACWARRLPGAAMPLLLALAWQAVALLWAPVREPGMLWLVERAAALAAGIGLAGLLRSRDAHAALATAGLGVLALTAATQGGLGTTVGIGQEAPFGNVNFAVGAALPLAAIGLARFIHGGGRFWWIFALGLAAIAGGLAGGAFGGDPCRAVWLGGGTALIAALVLRLPAKAHLPVLAALAVVLVGLMVAASVGFGDPGRLGAGSAYRVHLWRAAAEALAGSAALVGYGPGAAIAVLPGQTAYAAAWLTVPSWAAHAHDEPLQILLDGGLVLAALLAWALWRTITPLWHRRQEPAAGALLVGWITVAALALVESHLAQPGALLCLALLAAATWTREEGPTFPSKLRFAPLLTALVLAGLIVRELAYDGGGAVSIDARARAALVREPAERLGQLDHLRSRLGPLDDLDLQRAIALGRLGRHEEAATALAAQLDRLPVDAQALLLAERMRRAGKATPDLAVALSRARQRAAYLLEVVPANAVNREAREALAAALADDGPDPAR